MLVKQGKQEMLSCSAEKKPVSVAQNVCEKSALYAENIEVFM